MDLNAILNAVASGGPPAVATGVQRVPETMGNLGMINPVAVPVPPVVNNPAVVPPPSSGGGTGTGGGTGNTVIGGHDLGQVIPGPAGGTGNILGHGSTASVGGPRGDRVPIANLQTNPGQGQWKGGPLNALLAANANGQPGVAAGLNKPGPGDGSRNSWGANPDANKALAAHTGYQGDFNDGQFQQWLIGQPQATHQKAAQSMLNSMLMNPQPLMTASGNSLGAAMAPKGQKNNNNALTREKGGNK
jgi:hypothetical protein